MELMVLFIVVFIFALMSHSTLNRKRKAYQYIEPIRKVYPDWNHNKNYTHKQPPSNIKKTQNEVDLISHIENLPEVKVDHVIDTKSAVILQDAQKITIKLHAIDSPKEGQRQGDIAKYRLTQLISNEIVRLEEHGFDSSGRILATLYVQHGEGTNWINVNERMVALGHAWIVQSSYSHLPKERQMKLSRLAKCAKRNKVGLWKSPELIQDYIDIDEIN